MQKNNIIKLIEIITLGFIFPLAVIYYGLSNYIIVFLWVIFIYTTIVYYFFYKEDASKRFVSLFFIIKHNIKYISYIIVRWLIASIILYFFTYILYPEKLFIIQKSYNNNLLYKILLFYPILSAFPQEFIFCKFFFKRYVSLFKNEKYLVLMSSIIFCFAHIFVINWVAPFLGYLGGLMFANTYKRTQSLLIVTLEHALYGNTLFFLGLGWFFWGGSVGN